MSVLVFGSINMDLTAYVPRLPKAGETILGNSYATVPGGKGSNQAVACARLGAETIMVGRIGNDSFGSEILERASAENVDMSKVFTDPDSGTGLAVISVNQNAENSIIVISGANMNMSGEDVNRAVESLADVSIVLLQMEVSAEANYGVIRAAKEKNIRVVFDPAPASPLPNEIYPMLDFITPNEIETEQLIGIKPSNQNEAEHAAEKLRSKGVKTVVIKMGSQGSYIEGPGIKMMVPVFKVKAVDTVACGDAFNAGLAVALSEGKDIVDAVRWGAAAGAVAATKKGALTSMPYRDELEKLILSQTI